jgi:TetR/AcrR family tetracycline transcriptional repressor
MGRSRGEQTVDTKPRKTAPNLDIERIVEAAWKLVDRDGVDALSTRALAAELNVRGPALYWHVRNKQQLLSLMIERVLGASIVAQPSDLSWQEWLRTVCRNQRRVLLEHRDSGRIASSIPPTQRTQTEVFPQMFAPLTRAGFPREQAIAAAGSLASFLLGHVIYEQRPETREFVSSMVDLDAAFEFGLDAFITGFAVKLTDFATKGPRSDKK